MSVADQTGPRHEVARAVWVCIARDGLGRITMRSIAQELGTTTGFLSHYFSNKDEIIAFALDQVVESFISRIEPFTEQDPTLERLEMALHEVLPLDDERRLECSVYVNCLGTLIAENPLHRAFQEHLLRVTALIGTLTEGVAAHGALSTLTPHSVSAMVDGITIHALLDPEVFTPERQIEMLHLFLTRHLHQPDES